MSDRLARCANASHILVLVHGSRIRPGNGSASRVILAQKAKCDNLEGSDVALAGVVRRCECGQEGFEVDGIPFDTSTDKCCECIREGGRVFCLQLCHGVDRALLRSLIRNIGLIRELRGSIEGVMSLMDHGRGGHGEICCTPNGNSVRDWLARYLPLYLSYAFDRPNSRDGGALAAVQPVKG